MRGRRHGRICLSGRPQAKVIDVAKSPEQQNYGPIDDLLNRALMATESTLAEVLIIEHHRGSFE